MATTTAEMQDLQEVNRGSDKDLATQGPSEQGGALGLTKGGALPSLNEILAQPAVKKSDPRHYDCHLDGVLSCQLFSHARSGLSADFSWDDRC